MKLNRRGIQLMKQPRDYVQADERTNLPQAERRHQPDRREWNDHMKTDILIALTLFGIFGMVLGATAMWVVMS